MSLTKGTVSNTITYLIFLIVAVIGIYYGRSNSDLYSFVRVWNWSTILWMLPAVPLLFLQSRAGLPDFWTKEISTFQRIGIPVLIGITFGLLDVLVFKVMLHPEPYTELPPFLKPFPYSILLYFSGAFEIEVFYRLVPLTLILLIGKWWKQGKYFQIFFWTGAVLTALREPIEQLPDGNALLILYSLLTGFLMNLLQAIWYKKAGFIASLVLRLGHYLIWHILLGVYVQMIELGNS